MPSVEVIWSEGIVEPSGIVMTGEPELLPPVHTVVLTGISNGMILVNDPLTGQRLRWTVDEYATKWNLLGRRALGL